VTHPQTALTQISRANSLIYAKQSVGSPRRIGTDTADTSDTLEYFEISRAFAAELAITEQWFDRGRRPGFPT
jgi:hypothetical protein